MNVAGTKRAIGPLSPPPAAYTEDVLFTHPGGDAELRCTYKRNGSMYAGGLRFHRVRAFRFRAESQRGCAMSSTASGSGRSMVTLCLVTFRGARQSLLHACSTGPRRRPRP